MARREQFEGNPNQNKVSNRDVPTLGLTNPVVSISASLSGESLASQVKAFLVSELIKVWCSFNTPVKKDIFSSRAPEDPLVRNPGRYVIDPLKSQDSSGTSQLWYDGSLFMLQNHTVEALATTPFASFRHLLQASH
ncbi:integron integrase IntI4 [Striga asiatica]|uniref:Integron integrase IntI4 n=1 Tax=Striga asiatica TaxID=4170 RepID=A0A5A7QA81_STRAF|nr:integron integrase IntI4 [Striga asiatica]